MGARQRWPGRRFVHLPRGGDPQRTSLQRRLRVAKLAPGWRLATCTHHDDVGPDHIIVGVAGDVARVEVTLSNGRREWLTLYSDPTHADVRLAAMVYPRGLDIHRIDMVDASGEPLPDRL
jgi:hypothetical protein